MENLFTEEFCILSLTCVRKEVAFEEVLSFCTEDIVSLDVESLITVSLAERLLPPLQEFSMIPESSRNGRRSECVEYFIILSVLFQAWRSSIYILALAGSIKDDRGIYFLISLNVFSLLPLCSVNK